LRRKWLGAVLIIATGVAGALLVISLNYPKPFPDVAGIIAEDWEFSTYSGGTVYNDTAYGYPSLVFSVDSTYDSEVYMLSRKDTELPMTSTSMIRSSVSTCKIDWGWLGLGNNYAFLTWNGTCWTADTNNGSEVSEITIISGYDPSANWRKLDIEATSTGVRYYIDDQLIATHSSKIPSGDFEFYGELKSTGTASRLYIRSQTF
jgi:hypothetical protein